MKVKNIIRDALIKVGRKDIADIISADGTVSGEDAETAQTLVYCFNAVEDELARYYFPLVHEQEISAPSGEVAFEKFDFRPVKIISVSSNGKAVDYTADAKCIKFSTASVTVKYNYSPPAKTLDDESAYDGLAVTENLIACGAAAEYCLLNGCMQEAEMWESRYREEIDRARRKSGVCRDVPPRRWV